MKEDDITKELSIKLSEVPKLKELNDKLVVNKDEVKSLLLKSTDGTHMHIRILEPEYENFHSIKKIGRAWRIAEDDEPSSTKVISFDLGDPKYFRGGKRNPSWKKGIQGIGFKRVIPKQESVTWKQSKQYRVGTIVDWDDAISQAILVELEAIALGENVEFLDTLEKIGRVKYKYKDNIIEFLNEEPNHNNRIKNIDIIHKKGDDYRLIICYK
jgi:hypothetical protein